MKLTLDQTWKECLRMWKWISERWKPGISVDRLKKEWLKKQEKYKNVVIELNCFFCEYSKQSEVKVNEATCSLCPGTLVDKWFYCRNINYDYYCKPKEFYQKLLELDKRRRNKKEEK